MGDTITFTPNTGVNPTFVGRGSKIEHPDIFPIFLGSYWPGSGDLTVLGVMNALHSIVGGSYLRGLTQYGYVGPASVRVATIDTSSLNIALPALNPGVSQSNAVDSAIYNYISGLVDNNKIDNVDDNHDLIVIVFLDPAIPAPVNISAAGGQSTITGSNSSLNKFEFLDDNTRFEWAWVSTAGNSLANVTQTFSHELVESITDPFNSGWHQTVPAPGPSAGQIGDVCNQPAIVDGVAVSAYWSGADNACIVTTSGTRRVSLSQTLTVHEAHDGPQEQGYAHFPVICGGGDYFNYVERTYRNVMKVNAQVQGYESPRVVYTINGQTIPVATGTIEVEASWDVPRSNPLFPDLVRKPPKASLQTWNPGPMSSEISVSVGPNAGNTSLHIGVSVVESFDDPKSGGGSTKRTAFLDVDLPNQEIIWDSRYEDVKKNCDRLEHLSEGVGAVIGPPQPGDPPDLVDIVSRAVREEGAGRADGLMNAAQIVRSSRPEVANALVALAQRTR